MNKFKEFMDGFRTVGESYRDWRYMFNGDLEDLHRRTNFNLYKYFGGYKGLQSVFIKAGLDAFFLGLGLPKEERYDITKLEN